MTVALTFDVEDWYQTSDFKIERNKWFLYEDRVYSATVNILELLGESEIKATFFMLGCVVQKYPNLIKRVVDEGHELGTHGQWHRLVNKMTPEEFREDITNSKRLLEDLTGKACLLFRAPSWSISAKNLWALEILADEGFICDSSIQPFTTPLSGYRNAPIGPFIPVIDGKPLEIVEFPQSVLPIGNGCIPFSGGLYFRIMPLWFILRALKKMAKKKAAMLYLHPWEMDVKQPRLPSYPQYIKFAHYYNLPSTRVKLEKVIKEISFAPLGKLIEAGGFQRKELCVKRG